LVGAESELDPSLELSRMVILNPSFPEGISAAAELQLAAIDREKNYSGADGAARVSGIGCSGQSMLTGIR